jgi:hypothetical protein
VPRPEGQTEALLGQHLATLPSLGVPVQLFACIEGQGLRVPKRPSVRKVAFQPQPSELKDEVWVRLLLEDCEENSDDAEKNIWLPYSGARSMPRGDSGEGVMQNPLARAEHYRKG